MAATVPELTKAPAPPVEPEHDLTLKLVEGPTALGGSLRRLAFLTWTIAVTEFKLRFYGSILGYFWQLMRPLMLFGVLYVVFTQLVKVGGRVEHYEVVLLMNIVSFTYFAEGASAVTAVVDREQLVRKVQVPRLAIPLSVTLTATFNVLANFVVILLFALLSHVTPTWRWIELPFLIGMLGIISAGFAMLLSALYVRFRDVKPIWDVLNQVLFYATPVIYVLATLDVSKTVKELISLNPLAAILIQMRHAVIDPHAPSAIQSVGGVGMLMIPIGITFGMLLLGYWVFNREAPRIAEAL